ncbi:hypothetical protein D9M71_674670 [compost metagenome]
MAKAEIEDKANYTGDDYTDHHHIDAQHLPAHFNHLTEATVGGQQLGGHQHHPGAGQADTKPGDDRWRGGGQGDLADECRPAQSENISHLEVTARNGFDAFAGGQCDREESGLGNDDDLEGFIDAEQQHKHRDQRDAGDLAQGMEQRRAVDLDVLRQRHQHPERQAQQRADAETQPQS